MKKRNIGLLLGVGIGIGVGVYLATQERYLYFDRRVVKDAKKTANHFLSTLSLKNQTEAMKDRIQQQVIKESVVDNDRYRLFLAKLLKQFRDYDLTITQVRRPVECLFLLGQQEMIVNGEVFDGYPIYLKSGRYLSDYLTPTKEELLRYYHFDEGEYYGCYGLIFSFKINGVDWYIRLAYIEYEFKILSVGVMNGRYKSILK